MSVLVLNYVACTKHNCGIESTAVQIIILST